MSDTFRNRLIQAMTANNIKAADLAKRAGLSKAQISQYVNGVYEAKQTALYKLAVALNVSEPWLMGHDVPKSRTPNQINNDHLAKIIFKMRSDEDFFDVVCLLAELPDDQYAAVKVLLSNLVK